MGGDRKNEKKINTNIGGSQDIIRDGKKYWDEKFRRYSNKAIDNEKNKSKALWRKYASEEVYLGLDRLSTTSPQRRARS